MSESIEEKMVSVNQKELSLLVTNIIPTSKYFELRFDNMQGQITNLKDGQKEIRLEMDKRFDLVDKRFEQVDKRFEQVNLGQKEIRMEMDKRFEQVNVKLDQIMDRIDVKIDTGLREGRMLTVKLFSFAMVFSAISMAGLLAKMTGLF